MVSATSFTLVGVVNKFLTVLLNVMMWKKHSTPLGLVAVCLCLLAGSFYQQSPKRDITGVSNKTSLVPTSSPATSVVNPEEEEQEELLRAKLSVADKSLEDLEKEYEEALKL